jgi:para-nitrobenzyl esterase
MKRLMTACLLVLAAPALAQAPAAPPARAMPAPHYSVETTKMGELAANPVTRAIFEKYFPGVLHHPQFDQGLDLTLPEVVQYVPDLVTPDKLAAMDAELKALP